MKPNRLFTFLFYLLNSINVIISLMFFTVLIRVHPLLSLLIPYYYCGVRLIFYKVWYQLGYRPMEQRYYARGYRGGMHLPVFTLLTDEYRNIRKKQSLKYQIIYNIYKISYRTLYFALIGIILLLLVSVFSTDDYRYLGSRLQESLQTISGGNMAVEEILFVILILLPWIVAIFLYHLGRKKWQKYFYNHYPVKIILVERDEPIFAEVDGSSALFFRKQ